MRPVGFVLLAFGLAFAAAPAEAVSGTQFRLVTQTSGGDIFWALDAPGGAKNPDLEVPPDAEIVLTIVDADGGFHNLKVGGSVNRKTADVEAEGDEETLTFTSPASGELPYVCEYHASTMKGRILVTSPPAGTQEAPGDGSPGPAAGTEDPGRKESPAPALLGAILAFLGAALLVDRRRG